jgi:hypothetical protein
MQQKYAVLRHDYHYTIGSYTISALNLVVCAARDREDRWSWNSKGRYFGALAWNERTF